jgi:L-2-hydroxyglutarate oxidase LhgO
VTDRVDCVVVGAGVIGLAIARALALSGREVLVVERQTLIGSETSSRNSEVIHAGIYYPRGSLKARLCVQGRAWLYEHCLTHGVAHRQCGKLIVATKDAEITELGRLKAAAEANGVADLAWLDAAEAQRMEPALSCVAALHSPSTGIVDSHGFMLSLQGEAEDHGAVVAFGADLQRISPRADGLALTFVGEDAPTLIADLVVNAAGLDAPGVAGLVEGLDPMHRPRGYLAKGNYYALSGRAPFSRLIYPAPEPGGLGVHLTLDLSGQARFGPDVEWIETLNYDVNPARADRFYAAVRAYWPELNDGALVPAYAGVRPKLSAPGAPAADFRIDGPATHGVRGLVNLFGIESPGLTASLAIADHVAGLAVEAADA